MGYTIALDLGYTLFERLDLKISTDSQLEADLYEATEALSDVVNMTSAPPTMRICAAHYIGAILAKTGMIEYALPLLEKAVELLPSISPRSLSRIDQQHQLSRFKGLASDAAAVALDFGEMPVNVVRLLDSGRGILQGHILNIRGDIRDLPADLVTGYESLRALLDPPFAPFTTDLQAYRASDLRHVAALDFEDLLAKIRECEGGKFANFGLQLSPEAILEQGKQGPIVVLNINERRSDALIVMEDDVLFQPLNLDVTTVEAQVEKFRKAIDILTRPSKGTTQ